MLQKEVDSQQLKDSNQQDLTERHLEEIQFALINAVEEDFCLHGFLEHWQNVSIG